MTLSQRPPAPPEAGWRRKPNVRADGYEHSGAGYADTPTPRWVFEGPYAEEDIRRVMAGLLCPRCLQPFPCRLGSDTAAQIMSEMAPFGRPDKEARRLICASRCPMCAAEVSPEAALIHYGGVQESRIAATINRGEHGEYEDYIDQESPIYIPPGWSR